MKLSVMALAVLGTCALPALAADEPAASGPPEQPHPAFMAPLAAKRTLIGITAAGASGKLVAVGDRGHIVTSADGRQWTQVASPVDVMLNRVRFSDDKTGFALGHDATILATRDGGATWKVVHFDPASRPLYDIAFVDEQHLFAIGGYGLFLDSADGGATWTARDFPIGQLGQHFNSVVKLADGSWLVAGEKGLLMRSRDDGANWVMLDSPYTGSFFGVEALGDRGAVVFGLRGHVYASADVSKCPTLKAESYDPYTRETAIGDDRIAKLGWRTVPLKTTESLFGGARGDPGYVLVGVNGTVVKLDPGATTAVAPIPPDGETLAGVIFRNGSWLAVGRRGPRDLGTLASTAGEH